MPHWERLAKEHDIKYFLIAFVDLFGTMRAKIVPASAMPAFEYSLLVPGGNASGAAAIALTNSASVGGV